MKVLEIKATKTIGGNTFYLKPIPAFKCANLSGELAALIMPILTSIAPIAANASNSENFNFLDIDADVAGPALAKGLGGISGDRVENLLKKLLTTYRNVSVQPEGTNEAEVLTEELADNIFCGEVQDMFILAVEVIKVNFTGIFKKLRDRFGGLLDAFIQQIRQT